MGTLQREARVDSRLYVAAGYLSANLAVNQSLEASVAEAGLADEIEVCGLCCQGSLVQAIAKQDHKRSRTVSEKMMSATPLSIITTLDSKEAI